MGPSSTPQESDFLDYFARIDTDPIERMLIEHDIVLTPDILFQHCRSGKWSDVIDV